MNVTRTSVINVAANPTLHGSRGQEAGNNGLRVLESGMEASRLGEGMGSLKAFFESRSRSRGLSSHKQITLQGTWGHGWPRSRARAPRSISGPPNLSLLERGQWGKEGGKKGHEVRLC